MSLSGCGLSLYIYYRVRLDPQIDVLIKHSTNYLRIDGRKDRQPCRVRKIKRKGQGGEANRSVFSSRERRR